MIALRFQATPHSNTPNQIAWVKSDVDQVVPNRILNSLNDNSEYRATLEQHEAAQQGVTHARWGVLGALAGFTASLGILIAGGQKTSEVPPQPETGWNQSVEEEVNDNPPFNWELAPMGSMAVFGLLALLNGSRRLVKTMKRNRLAQELSRIQSVTLIREDETDPVRARLAKFVESSCHVISTEISGKARMWLSLPELKAVSASLQDLTKLYSDEDELMNLTRFVAYHWARADQEAKLLPSNQPVGELDLLIRQLTVLKTIQKTAMVLEMLEESPETGYIILNRMLMPAMTEARLQLEESLNAQIPNLKREHDLEQLLATARDLAQPFKMGASGLPPEVSNLSQLESRLAALKEANQAALRLFFIHYFYQTTALDQALIEAQRELLKETLLTASAELAPDFSPLTYLAAQVAADDSKTLENNRPHLKGMAI